MEKNLHTDDNDDADDSDQDMFSATPQRESMLFRSRTTPTTTTNRPTPIRKSVQSPASKVASPKSKPEVTAMPSPLREQNSILGRFVSSSQASSQTQSGNDDVDVNFYCVVSTGLNRQKRESFGRFLSSFKIATSKVLDDGVTHVVVDVTSDNCAVRTLKYIQVSWTGLFLQCCFENILEGILLINHVLFESEPFDHIGPSSNFLLETH